MEKTTCSNCEEKIDREDAFHGLEGPYCQECYENIWSIPSIAQRFGPKGFESFEFTAEFGNSEGDMPEPIKSEEWVKTDGWRGYTKWKLNDGWVSIADGWITGYPDETTERKRELGEYYEAMSSGKLKPPVDIWWIFGSTSNVFSSTSEIVCREEDEEAVKAWLLEIDGGQDNFKKMME